MSMHYAAKAGNLEMMQMLFSAGSQALTLAVHTETPIHLAVQNKHFEMVEWMLSKNVPIDTLANGVHRGTPLQMAIANFDSKMISLLIQSNAPDANPNHPMSSWIVRFLINYPEFTSSCLPMYLELWEQHCPSKVPALLRTLLEQIFAVGEFDAMGRFIPPSYSVSQYRYPFPASIELFFALGGRINRISSNLSTPEILAIRNRVYFQFSLQITSIYRILKNLWWPKIFSKYVSPKFDFHTYLGRNYFGIYVQYENSKYFDSKYFWTMHSLMRNIVFELGCKS